MLAVWQPITALTSAQMQDLSLYSQEFLRLVSVREVGASIFSGSALQCAKVPDLRLRKAELTLVSFGDIYSGSLKVGLYTALFKEIM